MDEDYVRDFIEIGDLNLEIRRIISFTKEDIYDYSKSKPIYYLIINKDSQNKLWYANTKIPYYSPENREEKLKELKVKLKTHNITFN